MAGYEPLSPAELLDLFAGRDRVLAERDAEIAKLRTQVAALEQRLARLERLVSRNSGNSSFRAAPAPQRDLQDIGKQSRRSPEPQVQPRGGDLGEA